MQWMFYQHWDTDALVLLHQGIISHSAEYAPICFQLFMGYFQSKTLFKIIVFHKLMLIVAGYHIP